MDAPLRPLHPGVVVAVAGISRRQDVARGVFIGDEVVLRHEVSNPYDRHAVSIETLAGEPLGYVPASGHLNERLLLGHAGGMWSGVVVDKYDGETIGLRVKILALTGHLNPAYGADAPGIRDVPETDPTLDETAAPAEGAAAPPVLVFSRSGRLLGTLLEEVGGKVRVQNPAGHPVSYAAGIVDVRTVVAS